MDRQILHRLIHRQRDLLIHDTFTKTSRTITDEENATSENQQEELIPEYTKK